jgi:hypothetical protein
LASVPTSPLEYYGALNAVRRALQVVAYSYFYRTAPLLPKYLQALLTCIKTVHTWAIV